LASERFQRRRHTRIAYRSSAFDAFRLDGFSFCRKKPGKGNSDPARRYAKFAGERLSIHIDDAGPGFRKMRLRCSLLPWPQQESAWQRLGLSISRCAPMAFA
jgi:hypothetical protein